MTFNAYREEHTDKWDSGLHELSHSNWENECWSYFILATGVGAEAESVLLFWDVPSYHQVDLKKNT